MSRLKASELGRDWLPQTLSGWVVFWWSSFWKLLFVSTGVSGDEAGCCQDIKGRNGKGRKLRSYNSRYSLCVFYCYLKRMLSMLISLCFLRPISYFVLIAVQKLEQDKHIQWFTCFQAENQNCVVLEITVRKTVSFKKTILQIIGENLQVCKTSFFHSVGNTVSSILH